MTYLSKLFLDDKCSVDQATLRHSEIKGFQAKHYKYISGGHRIDFTIKKAHSNPAS